ncbi:MAG: putative ribosome quality control (RQC) complex YloA/Tae2 family protein, partial [bacterium]
PQEGSVFRFYPENAIGLIEKEISNIKIFPNPTSDFLSIKNDKKVEMNYKIISIDGRTIIQGKSSKQNMQIDLRSLDAGMYFFHQNTGAKSISFIKN